MIVQSTRISRAGGVRYIERHLLDKPAENDRIVVLVGDRAALHDALALADLKSCKYALRHLSISPEQPLDRAGLSDFLKMIDAEFKIGPDRPRLLVMHEKKGRQHFHLAVAEVDPTSMKVLSCRNDFTRLEKLARQHEHVRDETVQLARAERRARRIEGFSNVGRKKAERKVEDFDRTKLKLAFAKSPSAFFQELNRQGLTVAPGEKGFILRNAEGDFVVAANRAVGIRRQEFHHFMEDIKDGNSTNAESVCAGRGLETDRPEDQPTYIDHNQPHRGKWHRAIDATAAHAVGYAEAAGAGAQERRRKGRAAVSPLTVSPLHGGFRLHPYYRNLWTLDLDELLRLAEELAEWIRSIFEPPARRYARQIKAFRQKPPEISPADAEHPTQLRYDFRRSE